MYMKNLFIKGTSRTPEIDFNVNGQLTITGNSYPEDVITFYEPVLDWLDEYLYLMNHTIQLNVALNYINTMSTKAILNLITKINSSSKNTVNVSWIYEIDDQDMQEMGEDLQNITQLKFDFVER